MSQHIPLGQSILPHIIHNDPQTSAIKLFHLIFTALSLIIFPFLPYILVHFIFKNNNIQTHAQTSMYQMQHIIGLSDDNLLLSTMITILICTLLLIMDICGVQWHSSLNTKNRQCYFDMFSEKKRMNSFIGHFGNTFSNFMYLFDGLCVLFACMDSFNNDFIIADTLFGFMLILLSFFSFLWHASNAPKSHYFDLFVMENCIIYLQIRYIAFGLYAFGYIHWSPKLGVIASILLYIFFILKNGQKYWNGLRNGVLDNDCFFSSRSKLIRNTHSVRDISLFLFMPIIFFIGPMIVLLYIGSLGHILSLTIAVGSLSLGWGIRMFDRWMLDGWEPINRFKNNTVMSALLSPTAIFHVLTGVTLITGYIHVHSLSIK